MTIGDKIKKIRTFRNMTQAELGAALAKEQERIILVHIAISMATWMIAMLS